MMMVMMTTMIIMMLTTMNDLCLGLVFELHQNVSTSNNWGGGAG